MKILTPLIITLAVGCTTHAGQKFVQPVPPPPPEEDIIIIAQAPAPKAVPAPAVAPLPPDEPHIVKGAHGTAMTWSGPSIKGFSLAGASAGSRRTIIIPKGEPNPELLADAEEDLNVMTLILEKALDQRSDDERKPMGIDLLTSSSGIRNLLIEGHGAIFALKTKIPLVPPPAPKKEEAKTKETTSSEWEEAKRQIYGPSEIEKEIRKGF